MSSTLASIGLWPWLALAGAGALHGLMPTSGWMLAAASGVRAGDARPVWRALGPLAAGHVSAVAVVAAAVSLGVPVEPWPMKVLACALVAAFALHHLLHRSARAGRFGLVLWSFMGSTLHGTGMMLVPALIPLCVSDWPGRELTASGSLLLATAAVVVHGVAMLGMVVVCALVTCGGIDHARRWMGARAGAKVGPVAAVYRARGLRIVRSCRERIIRCVRLRRCGRRTARAVPARKLWHGCGLEGGSGASR